MSPTQTSARCQAECVGWRYRTNLESGICQTDDWIDRRKGTHHSFAGRRCAGRTGASLIPEAAQAVGRNNIERLQIGIKHVDDDYCWKRDHRDNRKTMTSKGTEMLDFFTTSAAVFAAIYVNRYGGVIRRIGP